MKNITKGLLVGFILFQNLNVFAQVQVTSNPAGPYTCQISDIYAVQVPGYVYNDLFIKIVTQSTTQSSNTVYGITGADSWDTLKFTDYQSGNGYKILKANQTVNSTGVDYIVARKSSIKLTVNNSVICPGPLSASLSAYPTTVPYLGGYDFFTLTSTGALSCALRYKRDTDTAWSSALGIPSPNYTWKPYRGYTQSIAYFATCTDVYGKTVDSNVITMTVQPACQIADIFAIQVPGYVYNDLYIKIPTTSTSLSSSTVYGITGADSWNNLKFTEYQLGNGYKTLKANQTVNSTGVSYILARKSSIKLTVNNASFCSSALAQNDVKESFATTAVGAISDISSDVGNMVTESVTNLASFFTPHVSAMECVSLDKNIHRGDESKTTSKLQEFLADKGLFSEKVTGYFGDKTIGAVKAYQRKAGLPETGMVYDFTRKAIMEETCK